MLFLNNQILTIMKRNVECGSSGAVYGLGFIGSAVYFISHASSFWLGIVGFLKAVVWPAFLIYEAFAKLMVTG